MAEVEKRLADNAPGEFYVDRECIDCDVCRYDAPGFFRRNDENGYSYVYRQPETPEEIKLCLEAVENCPVEAIGNDG